MNKAEIALLQQALETVQAELEELEAEAEWFSSDCIDLVASALEIINKEKPA